MLQDKPLGEYLVEAGKISREQLRQALVMQANPILGRETPRLGNILVEMRAVSEGEVEAALQRQERERRRP